MKDFDLLRLRHNWDRAASATVPPLPTRVASIRAPGDPYPEAARLLERIRGLVLSEFTSRNASLEPFLREARELLEALRTTAASGSETAPASQAEDPTLLRRRLQGVLFDLEDLLEIFAGIGLP